MYLFTCTFCFFTDSVGYACAAYGGLTTMILPFILGFFSYVHWTNFLCVGVMSTGVVSLVYLSVAGWDLPPGLPGEAAASLSTTSIVAALLVGVITTIYRICQIFACNELESLSEGMAGLMGGYKRSMESQWGMGVCGLEWTERHGT